jgi:hypothetical protein
MHEQDIRCKLDRYILSGTEALQSIVTMLNSHARPPDLARAIDAILRRHYANTVRVDTVVALLNPENEA